jgi:hypothetical protein
MRYKFLGNVCVTKEEERLEANACDFLPPRGFSSAKFPLQEIGPKTPPFELDSPNWKTSPPRTIDN